MAALKSDIISGAYEQMRISGITVIPSAWDNALALTHLENMMSEFSARGICLNYNFEDDPDLTSLHNINRAYWFAIELLLADRLLAAFGKPATAEFARNRSGAQSFLVSSTALLRAVQPPARMPVGSGNRTMGSRFFHVTVPAPLVCASHTMYIGDIEDFVEHYDAYLDAGETISSYVLTADTGLTIVSESNDSPDINYQVSAVGGGSNVLQVKIVITTSAGRKNTRIINFTLVDVDVIE